MLLMTIYGNINVSLSHGNEIHTDSMYRFFGSPWVLVLCSLPPSANLTSCWALMILMTFLGWRKEQRLNIRGGFCYSCMDMRDLQGNSCREITITPADVSDLKPHLLVFQGLHFTTRSIYFREGVSGLMHTPCVPQGVSGLRNTPQASVMLDWSWHSAKLHQAYHQLGCPSVGETERELSRMHLLTSKRRFKIENSVLKAGWGKAKYNNGNYILGVYMKWSIFPRDLPIIIARGRIRNCPEKGKQNDHGPGAIAIPRTH